MTFNNKTIEELHNLLVSKEISATELTQATLENIKSREEALNSFVTIAEEQALVQAKAIDEAGIDADNVLSGIPLAVKDNISTDSILTTAASKCSTTMSQSLMRQLLPMQNQGHDCRWKDQHERICYGWFR